MYFELLSDEYFAVYSTTTSRLLGVRAGTGRMTLAVAEGREGDVSPLQPPWSWVSTAWEPRLLGRDPHSYDTTVLDCLLSPVNITFYVLTLSESVPRACSEFVPEHITNAPFSVSTHTLGLYFKPSLVADLCQVCKTPSFNILVGVQFCSYSNNLLFSVFLF